MMKPLIALAVSGLLALPALAAAETWTCRNMELEISCAEGCTVSEEHTPVDIFVSAEEMSICAYSGCWEGAPRLVERVGAIETYVGEDLIWSGVTEDRATIAVSVDTENSVATVLIPGLFAMPATCRKVWA